MSALATKTEEFRLVDRVFYLHAPDGIGRSKLAARAEKLLGVEGTGRNLRTVLELAEMVGGSQPERPAPPRQLRLRGRDQQRARTAYLGSTRRR